MALRQVDVTEGSKDRTRCPQCGEEALLIDSNLVQWITCPKCKFKKLLKKENKGIRVTTL